MHFVIIAALACLLVQTSGFIVPQGIGIATKWGRNAGLKQFESAPHRCLASGDGVDVVVSTQRSERQHFFTKTKVIGSALSLFLLLPMDAAHAKGRVDGSKTSKGFEMCVSKCAFNESRPPPAGSSIERLEAKEQKTIIRECRQKCAKTKAQSLIGEPKKSSMTTESMKN